MLQTRTYRVSTTQAAVIRVVVFSVGWKTSRTRKEARSHGVVLARLDAPGPAAA